MPEKSKFYLMKKLFFASIVMLAMTTSCNNSETTTAPEEQQNQTFAGKTTARDGDTSEEEKIALEEAIAIVKDSQEAELKNETFDASGRRAVINCHTPYNTGSGHACVFSGGYLFLVSWDTVWYPAQPGNTQPHPIGEVTEYTAVSVHSCRC